MNNVGVIICAAGASARFGGKKKKPFVEVGGRAAFLRSIGFFANRDDVKQILLVISPDDDELVKLKWGPSLSFNGVKICHGGATRCETVKNALELIGDDIDLVAVHDSVRCCLQDEWIDACFAEAAKTGAAILGCPVVSTLKKVGGHKIVATLDRTDIYEAQTPQVFDAELLRKAYKALDEMSEEEYASVTDDSSLVEMLGHEVAVVESDNTNIKITRQSDVRLAEAIMKSRPKPKPKGPQGPYIEAQW